MFNYLRARWFRFRDRRGYLAAIEDVPALGELKDGEFTAKLENLLENA